MDEYKAASYGVHKAVREANRRYGKNLELDGAVQPQRTVAGNITDYKATPAGVNIDSSMTDKLNSFFFARFKINCLQAVIPTGAGEEALTVTEL